RGIQLYSAVRYSRGRPAVRRSAATPSGPTVRSTKGTSPFVRMQLIFPDIADQPCLSRLVHEVRRDAHRVRERVAHRRLAIDRLLAPADLVLGRRALDRHRIADVAESGADRLVVPEEAPE